MVAVVVDVETTIFQNGNPFSRRNRMCYAGSLDEKGTVETFVSGKFYDIEPIIAGATVLVGFNLKFDLHWLRRYGIHSQNKRVWDCQFAHFLLTAQREAYPSLEDVCSYYGVPGKLGYIAENYWSKGIDTPDIPEAEMLEYLKQDLICTMEVFKRQQAEIEADPKLRNLMRLHMDDLLVLEDMEYNGLFLDNDKCAIETDKAVGELKDIEKQLASRYPNIPINWNSGDQLSAFLFGGTITVDRKEVAGVFATGAKVGEVRYRKVVDSYDLPRLVEPPEGSELAKADKEKGTGPWSTAEDVHKQEKQIPEIKLLLRMAELTKLLDYLQGWPELIKEKDWDVNVVHGQFNQVRARTGRLSSSSPNLQNLPDPMLQLIVTRFPLAFSL